MSIFAHIQIGVTDIERMARFYDLVLQPFGLVRMADEDAGVAGIVWHRPGRRWPQFVIRKPFNGLPATWGNGTQVSFAAPDRGTVNAAWAIALANGGLDEGAPGLRLRYAEDFYAAYCRDPEGNKLCFVHTDGM